VTQTPTVQTNKTISTVLPSLTPQQLNQFQVQQQQQQIHMQQQNTIQSYNSAPIRVYTNYLFYFLSFFLLDSNDRSSTNKLHPNCPTTTPIKSYACSTTNSTTN